MSSYSEELYLEMLQDAGVQYDADNVSEELMIELFGSLV